MPDLAIRANRENYHLRAKARDASTWAKTTASAIMHRLNCDPIEGMCRIALNDIECGTCRGKLHTKYILPDGQHAKDCPGTSVDCTCGGVGTRICQSCFGTGMECIAPELRARMFSELAKYKHPQFKQIEQRETDTERQTITLELVRPRRLEVAIEALKDTPGAQAVVAVQDEGIIDAEDVDV